MSAGSGGGSQGGTPTGPAKRLQKEKSDGVCTVVVRVSDSSNLSTVDIKVAE